MNFWKKIKEKFFEILRIHQFNNRVFDINRLLNHDENCAKNRIWYNGDSYEIEQFFKLIPNTARTFWGAAMTKGMEIRKIHVNLPKLLVDAINNVSTSDYNGIEIFNDEEAQKIWKKINTENDFKLLLKKSTEEVLKVGDGAFKISFDGEISALPIIEFYSSEDVEFVRNRGRIREVKFFTRYEYEKQNYMLVETYGYGYVKYNLYKKDNEVPLSILPMTANLQDVEFDKNIILAVPYMLWESDKYKGRGASIFDSKGDAFDAIDEVVSQWQDALRSGRVKTYIPECLIPRDQNGGYLLEPNEYDNKFITVAKDMSENAKNEIKVVQPDIKTDAYLQTYLTQLDICLQGLISPSTLGIDVKKTDNAEAQREKEKVTLYTRQSIIEILEKVLAKLGNVALNAYNIQYGNSTKEYEISASFGEYASPSFESVVEAMSNPNTPMSIEAKVDEIWGDSKSEEWKEEEVRRIKNERGIIEMEEPTLTNDNLSDNIDSLE